MRIGSVLLFASRNQTCAATVRVALYESVSQAADINTGRAPLEYVAGVIAFPPHCPESTTRPIVQEWHV